VTISGLHIAHGTPTYTYTPPAGGAAVFYFAGTACLNLRSGSYIDLAGNDLDTCTNGIFTAENTNSAWAPVTQLVTIMGNHIHGSGWSTDYTEHQLYFQSFYGLAQGNLLDGYLSTAAGSNVKWRGVEGIFRYNFLSSGPARDFDLVENQDATPYVSFEGYLSNPGQSNCNASLYCQGDTAGPNVIAGYQESAQKDFVYGNIIQGASSQYQIHYAEDHDGGMADRNGTLYFFSNTLDAAQVIFDTGSANGYNPYFTQRIDARNNLFWNTTTTGSAANQTEFGRYASIIGIWATNLIRSATFSIAAPISGGNYNGGTSNGWEATCDNGTCPWVLTAPINAHQYGLSAANFLTTATFPYSVSTYVPVAGSAAINAGSTMTGLSAQMPVRYQFSPSVNALTARQNALTIGAADSGPPPSVVSIAISPNPVGVMVGTSYPMVCTETLSDSTTASCTLTATWSNGGSPVFTVGSTGVINGSVIGTGTVTATLAGVLPATATVNITALPTTAAGALTFVGGSFH
jgi:hypothetical protein